MAPRTGRGGRRALLDDIHERDEAGRITRLEEQFHQFENQFVDRFGMLSQQIAALNIEQRSHSNSQHSEEEDDVDVNPFANRREQRRVPMRRQDHGRWESGFKLDIPEFEGSLEAAEFLDWIAVVEEILDFKDVPQDKRVSLVAT